MWSLSLVMARAVVVLFFSTIALASGFPLPAGLLRRMPHILAKRASGPGTCRVRPRSRVATAPGGKVNVGYFTNWGVYGASPFCESITLANVVYFRGLNMRRLGRNRCTKYNDRHYHAHKLRVSIFIFASVCLS